MPLIAILVPLVVQFGVQSTTLYPGSTNEHVVDDDSFTHFVTAAAGGIVAAQIRPAINIFDFIVNTPCVWVKQKPPNLRWLEVSSYCNNSVVYSIYSQPSNPKVEAIFCVIADNHERLLHPIDGIPINVFYIITGGY